MPVIAIVPSRKCIFKEISSPFFLQHPREKPPRGGKFSSPPRFSLSTTLEYFALNFSPKNRKSHPFFPSLQFLANLSFSFIYSSRLNRQEKDLIQFNLIYDYDLDAFRHIFVQPVRGKKLDGECSETHFSSVSNFVFHSVTNESRRHGRVSRFPSVLKSTTRLQTLFTRLFTAEPMKTRDSPTKTRSLYGDPFTTFRFHGISRSEIVLG